MSECSESEVNEKMEHSNKVIITNVKDFFPISQTVFLFFCTDFSVKRIMYDILHLSAHIHKKNHIPRLLLHHHPDLSLLTRVIAMISTSVLLVFD